MKSLLFYQQPKLLQRIGELLLEISKLKKENQKLKDMLIYLKDSK